MMSRHVVSLALRTFDTAALIRLCASQTTSFAPRRPRRVSWRRNAAQIGSASQVPISTPSTSRRPSVLTPMGMIPATETRRPTTTSGDTIHTLTSRMFNRTFAPP